MDTKLIFDTYNPEYKENWIQCFKDIGISHDIEQVDKIEDCLIEVIQTCVSLEEAFFLNALHTGSLPQEWINKVLLILNPPAPVVEKDEEIEKTAISSATTEKPLNTRRRLTTTRRANQKTTPSVKKSLAKTRRNH